MSSSPLEAEPAMARPTLLRKPAKLPELELCGGITIRATMGPDELVLH